MSDYSTTVSDGSKINDAEELQVLKTEAKAEGYKEAIDFVAELVYTFLNVFGDQSTSYTTPKGHTVKGTLEAVDDAEK